MLKEYEYKKALKLLDELLDKYNIPNKKSEDGIARIDGLVVDEYFDKIDLFDDIIDDKYDMPTQDIEKIAETSYEDDVELNEFVLAA